MKGSILIFALLFVPLYAFGQEGLFEYQEHRRADLTVEQLQLLEAEQSKPQTVNVHLVSVTDAAVMGERERLILNLPDATVLTVDRTSRAPSQLGQIRWNGSALNDDTAVRLLVGLDGITGMIRSKVHNYDIHPLRGSGYHVLVEIDPSGFDWEEPPLIVDGYGEPEGHDENEFDIDKNTMRSNPVIRLMVVYTTNARNNYPGDINQLISFAVGNMEDAFTSSGVNADVNLVHTAEISYSESTNATLDLCRLTTSQTFTPGSRCSQFSSGQLQGHMNQIHDWRFQHDAHLVVLITGSGGAGIAWTPSINTNYGFSVARYDVAASNYTLAHEIGHNLAAGHDPDNNEHPVYPYAHGYIYHPLQWTTILAYPPSGYSRINRYSTPLKTYAGVTTGTANLHDNARAMNNRVDIVASFSPPLPPLAAPTLTLDTFGGHPVLHWGTITGADAYKVYRGTRAGAPGSILCNDIPQYTEILSTTATSHTDHFVEIDPNGQILACYHVTAINQNGESDPSNAAGTHGLAPLFAPEPVAFTRELPVEFDLDANYPNPFTTSTEIRFSLPEAADVSLIVVDLLGREVARLVDGRREVGYHRARVDGGGWAGGVYLYRIEATGASGEHFTHTGRMTLMR